MEYSRDPFGPRLRFRGELSTTKQVIFLQIRDWQYIHRPKNAVD